MLKTIFIFRTWTHIVANYTQIIYMLHYFSIFSSLCASRGNPNFKIVERALKSIEKLDEAHNVKIEIFQKNNMKLPATDIMYVCSIKANLNLFLKNYEQALLNYQTFFNEFTSNGYQDNYGDYLWYFRGILHGFYPCFTNLRIHEECAHILEESMKNLVKKNDFSNKFILHCMLGRTLVESGYYQKGLFHLLKSKSLKLR